MMYLQMHDIITDTELSDAQTRVTMRLTWAAASYFKKYVQSEIAKATGVTVRKPFQRPREIRKRQWVFTEDRPWTAPAKEANAPNKNLRPVYVEPIHESQWKIFKGDRVSDFEWAMGANGW